MNDARSLGLGLALLFLFLVGCGRAPLTPVHGRVAFRGSQLQSGVIVFTPDPSRGERGAIALGRIQADGSFTLATGEAAGAHPGWYRVTVSSLSSTSYSGPGFNVPQSLLPEKYRDPELSMLGCEIKSGRTNSIDFNLE